MSNFDEFWQNALDNLHSAFSKNFLDLLSWAWPILVILGGLILIKVLILLSEGEILLIARFHNYWAKQKRHAKVKTGLSSLQPAVFAYFCRKLFWMMGYTVEENLMQDDGGVDILCIKDGVKTFVRCKKYVRRSVINTDIEDFVHDLHKKNAEEGIYLTTTVFTRDAMDKARNMAVRMIDGMELISLSHKYYFKELDPTAFEGN